MGIPREPKGLRRDYTRAPQVTKAYLLGLIHDATKRKTTIRVAQKNLPFLQNLKRKMKPQGINSWIYREGKLREVWILEFSSKHIREVDILSKQEKVEYLRGYFDAEGGIAKSSLVRFYLYYCQKNFDELVKIKGWLEDFGIECGVIHNPSRERDPDFWRFYIRAKSYVEFAKEIGSLHPDKWPLLRTKI